MVNSIILLILSTTVWYHKFTSSTPSPDTELSNSIVANLAKSEATSVPIFNDFLTLLFNQEGLPSYIFIHSLTWALLSYIPNPFSKLELVILSTFFPLPLLKKKFNILFSIYHQPPIVSLYSIFKCVKRIYICSSII